MYISISPTFVSDDVWKISFQLGTSEHGARHQLVVKTGWRTATIREVFLGRVIIVCCFFLVFFFFLAVLEGDEKELNANTVQDVFPYNYLQK